MEWVEIIELQTVDSNRDMLESPLQELINEVDMETKKHEIKAFSHAMIDANFSINLFHGSKMVEHFGSRLGLRLASVLREFGFVKHSIRIDMHGE